MLTWVSPVCRSGERLPDPPPGSVLEVLRGAPGCQRSSTPPCPLAPGDRATPGIRGSRPKALLTRPRAVLSSAGQECHVFKPPFPREDQLCGWGQCPQAGAGFDHV